MASLGAWHWSGLVLVAAGVLLIGWGFLLHFRAAREGWKPELKPQYLLVTGPYMAFIQVPWEERLLEKRFWWRIFELQARRTPLAALAISSGASGSNRSVTRLELPLWSTQDFVSVRSCGTPDISQEIVELLGFSICGLCAEFLNTTTLPRIAWAITSQTTWIGVWQSGQRLNSFPLRGRGKGSGTQSSFSERILLPPDWNSLNINHHGSLPPVI